MKSKIKDKIGKAVGTFLLLLLGMPIFASDCPCYDGWLSSYITATDLYESNQCSHIVGPSAYAFCMMERERAYDSALTTAGNTYHDCVGGGGC